MGISVESLNLSPEIVRLIGEIDEFKGAWKSYSLLEPERLRFLRKVATIESVGSSTRIEGSKLSDEAVEALLSRVGTATFRSRDEQEVGGYAFVSEEIFSNFEHIPFTENSIKQLHAWLLKYSEKDGCHRGDYKKISNNIEAFDESGKSLGVIFETASPFDTPFEMEELVLWVRESLEQKTVHPLIVVALFILCFLAIHPFQDGNGRLSRCLTTLLMLKCGYYFVPYSSLESIIEENKESYYLALRRSQQSLKKDNPDYQTWLLFFFRSLHKQATQLKLKVSQEHVLQSRLPELSASILHLLEQHVHLSIGQIEVLTKANRNTLKKHLESLVEKSLLLRQGKGRATFYARAR